MPLILSLDQGTTSSRAVLFDSSLEIKAIGQVEFEQIYPRPGWVEHDPLEIWRSQEQAIAQALAQVDQGYDDITCIGITNQRETTVLWNRVTGEPIHNAIVWQDRRTADHCETLRQQGHEHRVFERTGLLLDPYFSATKIAWLLDNVAGARDAAAAGELAFGTIDSWLIWNLTNGEEHLIEISNASRTSLLDIHSGEWDGELLEIFGIPPEVLPKVVGSATQIANAMLGDRNDVPITGVAGDQQAALFGQTCFEAGDGKCTYGTGCFLLVNTGSKAVISNSRLLTTIAWSVDNRIQYALEGSVFIGGALVQWLRDNLRIIRTAEEVEALAKSVNDSGGVVVVPAFSGLGAPHWDPHARGAIMGLTRGINAGHIARASLESIALQVCDLLDAMANDLGQPIDSLRVDGGASANDLLMQLQADFSGLVVQRAANQESTALGAAALAGLGFGIWASLIELKRLWNEDKRFSPHNSESDHQAIRRLWQQALHRSMAWESEPGV